MAYNSDVRTQISIPESGKFVEITGDSRFPSITCQRTYPNNSVEKTEFSKYAVLTHIVNASDISISLSSSNLDIGNVGIIDHTTGSDVFAQITQTATVSGIPVGAVLVKTHGTTPISGSVTVLNPVSSFSLVNPVTAVTVSNPISSFTLVNPVTAVTVLNPVSSFTLVNPVTSILVSTNGNTLAVSGTMTVANPVSSFSLVNPVTSVNITTNQTLPVSGAVTITNSFSTIPLGTQQVTFADSFQIDQQGRLRVSQPGVQWYYAPSIDKDGDFKYNEKVTGLSAGSIFLQNLGSVQLTSGMELSGSIIRASRRRHILRPGVSHQYFGTWNFDGQQSNTIKRIGMFTSFNGIFFELSGSQMSLVVRRRLLDGTLVEERAPKSTWNGDKLDGNGPSGENWDLPPLTASITNVGAVSSVAIAGDGNVYNVRYTVTAGQASTFIIGSKVTLTGLLPVSYNVCGLVSNINTTANTIDLTYATTPGTFSSNTNGLMTQSKYHSHNTWAIDFLGGRTSRLRFSKETNQGQTTLHTFNFANTIGTQYENAPSLTERRELVNFGVAPAYMPSFTFSGNSFAVEGAVESNPIFGTAASLAGVNIGTTVVNSKEQPIVGIALRTGEPYQRNDLQLRSISLMDINNPANKNNATPSVFYWRVLFNPGLSGVPASYNVGKSSRAWNYTTTTALTGLSSNNYGGWPLIDGFATSTATIDVDTALNFLNMGSNIDYTDSDKVLVTVKLLAAGTEDTLIVGSLNFNEEI